MHCIHKRRTEILAEMIQFHIPSNANILDIGCGDGSIGAAIKKKETYYQ